MAMAYVSVPHKPKMDSETPAASTPIKWFAYLLPYSCRTVGKLEDTCKKGKIKRSPVQATHSAAIRCRQYKRRLSNVYQFFTSKAAKPTHKDLFRIRHGLEDCLPTSSKTSTHRCMILLSWPLGLRSAAAPIGGCQYLGTEPSE